MIWKSLFLSFLLNKKDTKKKRTCRIKCILSENINTFNLDKRNLYSGGGFDYRHNITENVDDELIYNISRFFYKQKILKTLQDDTVSINTKLEHIYKYNSENNPSICGPNINAGGLWDDWKNDII
jgi:hypothetical protein